MRALARRLVFLAGLWLAAAAPAAASPFQDWSALVIAGDWHGSGGGPTEAFDNARRDVAQALVRAGFRKENVRQFSARPERYRDTLPARSDLETIYNSLQDLAGRAPGGCLFYVTTHGTPQGALINDRILPPGVLTAMLDRTCGPRPTVVIISACYSGVFVPQVAAPNRMVLTAARPDRTSFGCGESNKYPFFDECILQTMPKTKDFQGLATATRACVREREIAEKVQPPSEPQVFVGAQIRPTLPLLGFP